MTTNGDGARRAEIAARIVELREDAKMEQRAFAEAMNEAARQLALPAIYDIVKLSKIENAKRNVSLDDAYVIAALDPHDRGVYWITFGVVKRTGITHGPKRKRSTGGA